jgi:hypothetical protein
MNVEAIFIDDDPAAIGLASETFSSRYPPRADVLGNDNIPVYYTGSPIFGRFLLVSFPDDQPIVVAEVDITASSSATSITFEEPFSIADGALSPAPRFHCDLPLESTPRQPSMDV